MIPPSVAYHAYDANRNSIQTEKDNDLDNQTDEITYSTYDANGRIIRSQTDSDNDGDIDVDARSSWDDKGLPLRSEVDAQGEAAGIAYMPIPKNSPVAVNTTRKCSSKYTSLPMGGAISPITM